MNGGSASASGKGGGASGKNGSKSHQEKDVFPGIAALFPLQANTIRFELVLGSCSDNRDVRGSGEKEGSNGKRGGGKERTPVLKREAFINVYANIEGETEIVQQLQMLSSSSSQGQGHQGTTSLQSSLQSFQNQSSSGSHSNPHSHPHSQLPRLSYLVAKDMVDKMKLCMPKEVRKTYKRKVVVFGSCADAEVFCNEYVLGGDVSVIKGGSGSAGTGSVGCGAEDVENAVGVDAKGSGSGGNGKHEATRYWWLVQQPIPLSVSTSTCTSTS